MCSNCGRLAAVGLILAVMSAVPARGQISSQGVRERYERQTRGGNLDEFVRRLNGDDPEKRLEAVRSLEESKDPKAIEYLMQALGDADMRIKAKAIDALGNLRATEATPVLIQHLFLRETDASVKQRILASLGKIGDARAAAPIVEFLQRDLDPATRGTAIFALGEIGAAEALPALEAVRQGEGDASLRRLAGEAVAKVQRHQSLQRVEAKQPQDTFLKPDEPPPPQ